MEKKEDRDEFIRTEALLGEEAMAKLASSRVAVFGIGGVGSYVAEALCRCGFGALDLIDPDTVAVSNLNRQIEALHSTIGQPKVLVMKKRMEDICPRTEVTAWETFVDSDTIEDFPFDQYDYVVDAVDTVTAKLLLIEHAKGAHVPVISCMGVGNKLHPEQLKIADISETRVCPLAKVMRKELKRRAITDVKVLYSEEPPRKLLADPGQDTDSAHQRRAVPGSISFVPSVAGLLIAGYVIRDIAGI